jgi:hypothetical protein
LVTDKVELDVDVIDHVIVAALGSGSDTVFLIDAVDAKDRSA